MNIFIHRRDLRFNDNTSLNIMINKYEFITPIFIFDPIQIDKKRNKYFSNNLVEFMCDTLLELKQKYQKKNIEFLFFEGKIIDVLEDFKKKNKINSIGFNKDYSPYSKDRDSKILEWCKNNFVDCIIEEDMLISPINIGNSLNPNSKKPYLVYTPFKNNLMKYKVEKPFSENLKGNVNKIKSSKFNLEETQIRKFYINNDNKHVKGGRDEALKILSNISLKKDYNKCRDYLTYSTTNLSAYINLGIVSIREVYHKVLESLGKNNLIINELYWRDFYYNILHYFPRVVGNSFKEKYDNIKWENNEILFEKWKKGETGFPIVDACMRQLNNTGFMHNRGRMIVASFLTKDLLIDWKLGERYFATKLVDCNISANNGGWQWAAGTGTDAQPYFRIFNPWSQSLKFDPDCKYIKKWIPELKNEENKHIHEWYKYHNNQIYPEPIIDHKEARKKALELYKNL